MTKHPVKDYTGSQAYFQKLDGFWNKNKINKTGKKTWLWLPVGHFHGDVNLQPIHKILVSQGKKW